MKIDDLAHKKKTLRNIAHHAKNVVFDKRIIWKEYIIIICLF